MGIEKVPSVKRSKAQSRSGTGLDEFLCHTMKPSMLCFCCLIERTAYPCSCFIPMSGDAAHELCHSDMEQLRRKGLDPFFSFGL